MPKIAISYRRRDSQEIVGRILDRLVQRYGKDEVFIDIDNIPVGVDFRSHIDGVLQETEILVAIVGTRWRAAEGHGVARILEEADPVRVEVETAFARSIRIVPVLIGRAVMPEASELPPSIQEFSYLNAVTVDPGLDFDYHVTRLITVLNPILGFPAEDVGGGGTWAGVKDAGPIIVKYLLAPVLLLALMQYEFVYRLDFSADRVQIAAVLIALASGFSLTWFDKRGPVLAALLGVGTAVLSVAAMQMTGHLIDGATFVPSGAADWREVLNTTALIVLAMAAGSVFAHAAFSFWLRRSRRGG
jgi:hypothetical protein